MGNNEDEKLYRVKTKDGAHINEKVNQDGSRAAIQFDEGNGLQGPVDLIEVDEDEYTREVYVEVERKERSIGEVILEDAVAPALTEVLTILLERAVDAGVNAIGNVMSQKVIPTAKAKGGELIDKAKASHVIKKEKNTTTPTLAKKSTDVGSQYVAESKEESKVYHSSDEVDQIINNMRVASLYIAAGIRELSNTIVTDNVNDPKKIIEMQNKLNELSSEQVLTTIDFMLEDKNRDKLDQATLQFFEAFRNGDIIVGGEAVPISNFINDIAPKRN